MNWECYSMKVFLLKSITRIDQTNFWQFINSIIQIALVIFKYLLSINRIAKLQSVILIDYNSNTEYYGNVCMLRCPTWVVP